MQPKVEIQDAVSITLTKSKEFHSNIDESIIKKNSDFKKKIRYNNPDDYDKKLKITSASNIIEIRNTDFLLEHKSIIYDNYFNRIPFTLGRYKETIFIENQTKGDIEEVLRFNIDVKD